MVGYEFLISVGFKSAICRSRDLWACRPTVPIQVQTCKASLTEAINRNKKRLLSTIQY